MATQDGHPEQISYSVKQAAAATGLSDKAIRRLIYADKLPARYNNTTVLIPADALKAWFASLPSEHA